MIKNIYAFLLAIALVIVVVLSLQLRDTNERIGQYQSMLTEAQNGWSEAQERWGYWMDSSAACYTAQDEVLVFIDQAIKNMGAFYCSEALRTDEIACNIMDARFVIVENSQEEGYPE